MYLFMLRLVPESIEGHKTALQGEALIAKRLFMSLPSRLEPEDLALFIYAPNRSFLPVCGVPGIGLSA